MSKELITAPTAQALAELESMYPVEQGFQRILLPRISLVSQDKTEGKGKSMKVVTEAGTFFTERETEETTDEGKKIWDKKEIGTELKAIIIYKRKQLKYYDESTGLYTSSPIYDNDDEIIPLFCDKKEIDRGTPKELQAKYPGVTTSGKATSKLEVNRILYVLFNGELYQWNLRGSSMFSFLGYEKKVRVPAVLTKISSESKEKGSIKWNQATFEVARQLNADEVADVISRVKEISTAIKLEKSFYASQAVEVKKEEDDF